MSNRTGVAGGCKSVPMRTATVPPRIPVLGLSISKGCVPICPSVGVDIGIAAMSVHCCSSFLCNISGANSIQINHLVLALATLTSFFYLFGSRL
ncbi:hypothetical protein E2320_011763 [Naja naja]|nr:hypothetical protein E2320_011763 [Naja naja]